VGKKREVCKVSWLAVLKQWGVNADSLDIVGLVAVLGEGK
jgi:hypothetical protein